MYGPNIKFRAYLRYIILLLLLSSKLWHRCGQMAVQYVRSEVFGPTQCYDTIIAYTQRVWGIASQQLAQ
jgi:hypothetical protein